jgi:poly-gamma-glutamate capsule biosynthesis protein CapA/YwtB (metallophosphatase superfamily)
MRRALLLVAALLVLSPAASARTITVAVSGDLLIHEPVWRQAATRGGYDFRPMLRRIRPLLSGADLAICHVETPLTAKAPSSFPTFSAPVQLAAAIRRAGWDACSTASNHTLDQGPDGVRQTLRALDRQGIAHTGSALARRPPLLLDVGGVKVALLAYAQVHYQDVAGAPWLVNAVDRDARPILAEARRARALGAQVVIVNVHWGEEFVREPTADQLALAGRFARSPLITAIVGQHAHVVQPIRVIAGMPVLFGEGNLLSAQAKDDTPKLPAESQDGLIGLLRIRVPAHGRPVLRRIDYVPVYVDHDGFVVTPVSAGSATPEYRASWERTVGTIGRGPRFAPQRGLAPLVD